MGRKTMRKYKGGVTPKKSTGTRSKKYFGFDLPSQGSKRSRSKRSGSKQSGSKKSRSKRSGSFGFFGFVSSQKKSTVRCQPNDIECLKLEKLKKIADNRKSPLNTAERRAVRLKSALETKRNLEKLEEERQYNFYLKEIANIGKKYKK
jgi:hypothetical protein